MARPKKVTTGIFGRLAELFSRMEEAYQTHAAEAGLTCKDCTENCCSSYFRHHTYVEWIYLLKGVQLLPQTEREKVRENAARYVENVRSRTAQGQLPEALCPLNVDGLCILYSHRLMICRMHGTRNVCHMPDGRVQHFPGCWRYVENARQNGGNPDALPALDRTPFYRELATLEGELYKKAGRELPRVNLTIAEMILHGPPPLR